jgi:hypothetical protein
MLIDLCDKLQFYRHRTNWHKLPLLRDFLCWIGRHDYELGPVRAVPHGVEGELYCFYCERKKRISTCRRHHG